MDGQELLKDGIMVKGYVVEAAIAAGGFGTVWRVRHADTGAHAAVKVLHAQLISSAEMLSRFEREVKVIQSISHPNVVRILEYDTLADGRPYFVMEYLDGVDLDTYLAQRGPLLPVEALAILSPLADALSDAHSRGIIHRDVKASNVMLCGQEPSWRVVLLDFGVARLLESDGTNLTASRATVGSATSMAPEQLQSAAVDARADVYALGVLLYQMLTGEAPFANVPAMILDYLRLYGPRPLLSQRSPALKPLDHVVTRAMAVQPAERFASPVDMTAALRDIAVSSDTLSPTPEDALEPASMSSTRALIPAGARALGLYVDAHVREDALDDMDSALIEALEGVVPAIAAALAPHEMPVVRQTGNAALLARLVPDAVGGDARCRRVLAAAQEALARLEQRRDPRVVIALLLHTDLIPGDVERDGYGALMELAVWARDIADGGLVVTPAAIEGLEMEIATEPVPGPRPLLRVIAPDDRG